MIYHLKGIECHLLSLGFKAIQPKYHQLLIGTRKFCFLFKYIIYNIIENIHSVTGHFTIEDNRIFLLAGYDFHKLRDINICSKTISKLFLNIYIISIDLLKNLIPLWKFFPWEVYYIHCISMNKEKDFLNRNIANNEM